LGRWGNCDPQKLESGDNLYRYVLGNPLKFIDPSGLEEVDANRILNELVISAQSLGGEYRGTSVDSVRLHDILRTELPKSVGNSPRLITEAIIDKAGKVVAHGIGPQEVMRLPGGNVKGTYQTIDVLVIDDNVSARDIQKIRAGELSAKGKVIPADLKLGGAAMSKKAAEGLKLRLGAAPVLIGQHGRYFTSKKVLRRVLDTLEDVAKHPLGKFLRKAVRPASVSSDIAKFIKDQTIETGASIAGEAAGVAAGAKLGAAIGAPLGPIGAAVGGIIGGVVGGIAGSAFGRAVGGAVKSRLNETRDALEDPTVRQYGRDLINGTTGVEVYPSRPVEGSMNQKMDEMYKWGTVAPGGR
jgi:hypothetical protein